MQENFAARPVTAWLLITLQILLALGALLGGGAFLLAPDGHLIQMPIAHLNNTPFSDFLIPGAILFTLLGIYPLAVAYSLWKKPAWRFPDLLNPFKQFHWSWSSSLAVGAILIIWITVQVQWIEYGWVHTLYLAWGVALLFIGLLPNVRRYYKLH